MTPEWILFDERGDNRGSLVAIEGGRNVPFQIRRVYTLHGMSPRSVRGGHAHRTLRQVMVCLAGSCVVDLDDGRNALEVVLDKPSRGLVLEPMIWHVMRNFSEGCVLMVLAAEYYQEADYIRDHAEFLNGVGSASA